FSQWTTLWGAAADGTAKVGQALKSTPYCQPGSPLDPVRQQVEDNIDDLCTDQSPTTAVASGEFSDWSTVWDAIGYTDSGFSGDFFAQSSGMNAPGYDIEMAYNHITVDSQYEAGALFNDYHVTVVRHVVKSF